MLFYHMVFKPRGRFPVLTATISSDTLLRRLKTGVKIDVLELDLIERDGRDTRVYWLTEDGQSAYDRLAEAGGVDASHRIREAWADLKDARQELRDLIQPAE